MNKRKFRLFDETFAIIKRQRTNIFESHLVCSKDGQGNEVSEYLKRVN